jgi:hypothetical protein
MAAMTYQEFLSTQPPLFTKADDLLGADVWLRVMESKFPLLTRAFPDDTKTQGTRIVLQYAQAFNDLCQYAGYHADSDEKKRDRFRRGLNTKLRERLNIVRVNSFNELVNMAIS